MNQQLLKPTYLKTLCDTYDLTPSKKYGQNYLISSAPIDKMIISADVQADDTVIEIGPGFGVLTYALAEHARQVYTFEIEKKLHKYWEENAPQNVFIIWGNVLHTIQELSASVHTYKVVANLPYQITSRVLRTILELDNKPTSLTVMVQREVAERIIAKPGDMSILAVSVQYYGDVRIVTKVPSGNFWPAPKVESAVIHIHIKNDSVYNKTFDEQFFSVVRAGFANKRKQLWRNVHTGLSIPKEDVISVLQEICGNEKIRAEELSIEQWISITKRLHSVL